MSEDCQTFWNDRAGLWRLARIVAACALLAFLIAPGLAPPTRNLTLLTLAASFSAAAIFELAMRDIAHRWFALPVVLIFVAAGISDWALMRRDQAVPEFRGTLRPGTELTSSTACGRVSGDALVIAMGRDAVLAKGNGPFMPARIGTCALMTLTRHDGSMLVNAAGYDSDGNIVYRIKDNEFSMVLRGFLVSRRPDASTLLVADIDGKEAFSIRYLNRNMVRIRGTFRCQDSAPLTIADDSIAIGSKPVPAHPCAVLGPGLRYGDGSL